MLSREAVGTRFTAGAINNYNQVSRDVTGDYSQYAVEVKGLPGSRVRELAVGDTHTCALVGFSSLSGRKVYCWGANHFGQLGDGRGDLSKHRGGRITKDPLSNHDFKWVGVVHTPKNVKPSHSDFNEAGRELTHVEKIYAGKTHTCAVTNTGTSTRPNRSVYCWGDNRYNQVSGDVTANYSQYAVKVSIRSDSRTVELALGDTHTCALADGSLSEGGVVKCWGDNRLGQLGDGRGDLSKHRGGRITKDPSSNHDFRWLGVVHKPVSADPKKPAFKNPGSRLTNVEKIYAGKTHTCAVTNTGTSTTPNRSFYCWGDNRYNQVIGGVSANDSYSQYAAQVSARGVRISSSSTVELALGDTHTCVLADRQLPDQKGIVQCWGDNRFGQLGNGRGNLNNREGRITGDTWSGVVHKPVNRDPKNAAFKNAGEELKNVEKIYAGKSHTCAVTNTSTSTTPNRSFYCWGDNRYNQVSGDVTADYSQYAVQVSAKVRINSSNTVELALGDTHTCVLRGDDISIKKVQCWGDNRRGQLGDGRDNLNNRESRITGDKWSGVVHKPKTVTGGFDFNQAGRSLANAKNIFVRK